MRWNTPPGAAGPPPGAPQRRARSSSRREILALHVLAASLTSLPPPQPALGRVDMHMCMCMSMHMCMCMCMHSARAYGPPACRTHLRRRAACPVAPLLHPRRTPASAYCGTVAPQALGRTTPLVGDSADQPPAGSSSSSSSSSSSGGSSGGSSVATCSVFSTVVRVACSA